MKIYIKNDFYTLIYKESGGYRGECFKVNPFECIARGKSDTNNIPLYGKRVKLSSLPDEAKEYALRFLHLPNFRLPKAYSKYGAQMGRMDKATGKCKLGKVRLYDGYDIGGAYWGSPSDLYCAKSKTALATGYFDDPAKPGFSFVRANSPYEAIKHFENMGLVF